MPFNSSNGASVIAQQAGVFVKAGVHREELLAGFVREVVKVLAEFADLSGDTVHAMGQFFNLSGDALHPARQFVNLNG